MANENVRVLVTGASGFVAGHCVQALLDDGYRVRGTVRSLANEAKVAHLRKLGAVSGDHLALVEADLTRDEGWPPAVDGCTYVLHVASPFPSAIPDDEQELIGPAVDGTRRVLEAAAAAGVRRVVLTSSVAAVAFGHGHRNGHVFTEEDWSVVERAEPYQKSKTLAERAAWDLVASLPPERKLELAVINPGFVAGPLMSNVDCTSAEVVRRLLARDMPACPQLGWSMVDVRDVARAHLLAMTTPAAAGNRYICAGEHIWMRDIAKILADEFNPQGYRVPTGHLPYFALWLASRFDKTLRLALRSIGKREEVSSEKARRELGWQTRPYRETLVDMGASAIALGLVPPPR